MRMRDFIKNNRIELDDYIKRRLSFDGHDGLKQKYNNKVREQWILTDESLYYWAKNDGVPI